MIPFSFKEVCHDIRNILHPSSSLKMEAVNLSEIQCISTSVPGVTSQKTSILSFLLFDKVVDT